MWKNGLGWTDQIAISPPGADLRRGDFDWRLSTARVAQSSDFSAFPEHDRVLVVLEGEGVQLTHTFDEEGGADQVDVQPLEPYEFPGDVPTRCELVSGPFQDLSVFARKGRVEARVEVRELGAGGRARWETGGATCFLFAARGSVEVEGVAVAPGSALRIEAGAGSCELRAERGAVAVLVHLDVSSAG